ncbi:hypothetical protein [Muribaculum intestinale]|uniref:hypothetical protein n=1 Tax=Muribaculum intestinale TaxID=1796646 RepID=UPI0025A96371|nr:hypothetical protein [Muribaculum intestinale]
MTSIFNHNGALLMGYMVFLNCIAILCVAPQFSRNSKHGIGLFALAILTFLMSLLPIQSGDFIYYGQILQTGRNFSHFEDFYQLLWLFNPDYIEWRAVVWGACVLLLIINIKLLHLNGKFAAFIFIITQFFYFGTMRNMFGFMLMFVSVTIFYISISSVKKYPLIIIAALGLWGSTFLHRSMWMYVLFLIVGIIPINKYLIKISLIAFPFAWTSVFVLSSWFLSTFADTEMQTHADAYTSGERVSTILQTTMELIKNGAYLYLLYIVTSHYCRPKCNFPNVIKFLIRYSYFLFYVGFLFLGQTSGGWLYSRFTEAGQITFMFVMMYFFYNYPRTRNVKIAFGVLIVFILYRILYITMRAPEEFIARINTITI